MYYYDARPQLCRIEARLELAALEARGRKLRRARELSRHPDSPGPAPEEVESKALREAIEQTLFALRLLHS